MSRVNEIKAAVAVLKEKGYRELINPLGYSFRNEETKWIVNIDIDEDWWSWSLDIPGDGNMIVNAVRYKAIADGESVASLKIALESKYEQ